jgi:hypothetical protein
MFVSVVTTCGFSLKADRWADDRRDMMISNEQVERALAYLRDNDHEVETSAPARSGPAHASDDLVARVRDAMLTAPDTRADRVAEARAHLAEGIFSSDAVADKMVGRLIGDSLR